MTARALAVLAALALAAQSSTSASGGWRHVTVKRQSGRIEATLSYEARAVDQKYRRMTLVVRRSGTMVIDWLFQAGYEAGVALTLRNVWGNGDPEALVEIQTGGQICCAKIGVARVGGGQGGRVIFHDFGNGWGGSRHEGTFDFVSSDTGFFCYFSDCASSSDGPIQIFAIDRAGSRFLDVTRSRPDLIAADAARQWQAYRHEIVGKEYWRYKHPGYDPLGVLAPWCADQYLLGRKDHCSRVLERALAKGYLNGPQEIATGGQAAISRLQTTLTAWGYDQRC